MGALLLGLALTGCSAVRLGYNNAPSLAYLWLHDYFDFDNVQTERMRADLQTWHQWHRAEELPLLQELLKNLQAAAMQPVTPEQVCNLYGYLQTRLQVPADRFAPALAALAPTLKPAQIEHIGREFEKRNRRWREQWMDDNAAQIAERRADQLIDRAESFYGRLDAAQIALITRQVAITGFNAALVYKETLRRQQDALQLLKDMRTNGASGAQIQAEFRALFARALNSPDPSYREYVAQLSAQSCAVIATLHNSTQASQRAHLVQKLQDYEDDVRALSAR